MDAGVVLVVVLCPPEVLEPADVFEPAEPERESAAPEAEVSLADYLQRCERYFLLETLERRGWQIGATARALGISRKNLWERMRRLDIAAAPATAEREPPGASQA